MLRASPFQFRALRCIAAPRDSFTSRSSAYDKRVVSSETSNFALFLGPGIAYLRERGGTYNWLYLSHNCMRVSNGAAAIIKAIWQFNWAWTNWTGGWPGHPEPNLKIAPTPNGRIGWVGKRARASLLFYRPLQRNADVSSALCRQFPSRWINNCWPVTVEISHLTQPLPDLFSTAALICWPLQLGTYILVASPLLRKSTALHCRPI